MEKERCYEGALGDRSKALIALANFFLKMVGERTGKSEISALNTGLYCWKRDGSTRALQGDGGVVYMQRPTIRTVIFLEQPFGFEFLK